MTKMPKWFEEFITQKFEIRRISNLALKTNPSGMKPSLKKVAISLHIH